MDFIRSFCWICTNSRLCHGLSLVWNCVWQGDEPILEDEDDDDEDDDDDDDDLEGLSYVVLKLHFGGGVKCLLFCIIYWYTEKRWCCKHMVFIYVEWIERLVWGLNFKSEVMIQKVMQNNKELGQL